MLLAKEQRFEVVAMFRILPFAGFLLLSPVLPAQQTRVVPWTLEETDGNTTCAFPFGYTAGRTQQVIDGAALCSRSALLMGMALRRDGRGTNTYKSRVIPSLEVRMGHTKVTPSTMSTSFAANRTGTMVAVFPRGTFHLPPLPPMKPRFFPVAWSWAVPFIYCRSTGNLLVEIVISGNAGKSEYFMDAHGSRSLGGRASLFGKGGALAGGDPFSVTCPSPSSLVPGGTLTLAARGLKKAYTSLALVGTSRSFFGSLPLPFDLGPLGAPGNFLYVRPTFFFSLPLTSAGGSFGGTLSLPLPSDSWFGGAKFFGQVLFADKASNALGLVFSGGVELNLGLPGPPVQLLGSPDAAKAVGYLNKRLPTGLVIRFTGVFS